MTGSCRKKILCTRDLFNESKLQIVDRGDVGMELTDPVDAIQGTLFLVN
jgi:hypothetical protein